MRSQSALRIFNNHLYVIIPMWYTNQGKRLITGKTVRYLHAHVSEHMGISVLRSNVNSNSKSILDDFKILSSCPFSHEPMDPSLYKIQNLSLFEKTRQFRPFSSAPISLLHCVSSRCYAVDANA